ncbi:hypothetical protein ACFPYJ_08855 [Paenibacillus solisilvae]|uniref:HEAT repeat domain-containing protein n=1 Tax=Paenibacillus solisilvae TaxID=2486751 RepID=A0ABW0VUW3_9BACL
MQLFSMKSVIHGTNRMEEWLEENYVSFGWPELCDLEGVSKEEAVNQLSQPGKAQGRLLDELAEEVYAFVYAMQDGDYLLVAEEDRVHLGNLGDYYYVDQAEAAEDDKCHRRGVTWLQSRPRTELHEELQRFLEHEAAIGQFERPVTHEQLEWLLSGAADVSRTAGLVDVKTIEEALDILKQAMRSDDAARRERAAAAILQFAK